MILTIEAPGTLLPVVMRREITAEEAQAVRQLLDPPDPLADTDPLMAEEEAE